MCPHDSLAYYSPNLWWTLLGLFAVVAIFFICFSIAAAMKSSDMCWVVLMPITSASASAAALYGITKLAGIGALIAPLILWVLGHICLPLFVAYHRLADCRRRMREQRLQSMTRRERVAQAVSGARQRLLEAPGPTHTVVSSQAGSSSSSHDYSQSTRKGRALSFVVTEEVLLPVCQALVFRSHWQFSIQIPNS